MEFLENYWWNLWKKKKNPREITFAIHVGALYRIRGGIFTGIPGGVLVAIPGRIPGEKPSALLIKISIDLILKKKSYVFSVYFWNMSQFLVKL